MTNKKTDTFSRIVAFITAFAVAMLTVTLIHRTVISAEEAYPEMTDASETTDGNVEIIPSEITSEEQMSLNSDNVPSNGETQGDFNDDNAVSPDSNPLENDPEFSDLIVDPAGIVPYADTNVDGVSKDKTPVTGVINPVKENMKIYKGDSKIELADGETVKDGDGLSFYFEWNIDNDDHSDYSNSYFVYDLTDFFQGVTLTPRTYIYWVNEHIMAVYEIANVYDPEKKEVRTKMYIEPREGFQEGSSGRSGSIRLEGAVSLNEFPVGNPNVELIFFDKKVNVYAPSLDNSIQPQKWRIGSPEKRVENGVVNYYQKYQIYLYNQSDSDADGITALDIPGGVFNGAPQNVFIWYGNNATKTPSQATAGPDGGYIFSVGGIPGKSSAYIEYEIQIDTEKALNPSIDQNDPSLKNTVKVPSNTNPDASSAEASVNLYDIVPHVEKSGVIDNETNTIKWTIKVKPNGLSDKNFTVNDIIDDKLTLPNNINWSKDAFTLNSDGIWEMSYDTELPENVTNNQNFHNRAEVKFDGYPNYVYTGEGNVTYQYDVGDLVQKECMGLNAVDGTIDWKITANIPERSNNKVSSIVMSDSENAFYSQYNKVNVWNTLLKYDADSFTMQIDNGEEQPIGSNIIKIEKTWDDIDTGFTLTFDDTNFISNIAGKKITISYKTPVADQDKYKIGNVSRCRNDVKCTVKYENDTLEDNAYAEYINEREEPFTLKKGDGRRDLYVPGVTKVDPNKLRECISWSFIISDIKNLDPDDINVIEFDDTAPKGYTFDTRVDGNSDDDTNTYPDHFVGAEIVGAAYDPDFKPEVECYDNHTRIHGKITLTPEQAKYIVDHNSSIKVDYYTQMTKEYQSEFLAKCETQTFTNTVSVPVDKNTSIEATHSVEKTPDKNTVIKKSSENEPIDDVNVEYTIDVNSNGMHLGNADADTLILTDKLGKYLKLNKGVNGISVTPSEGTSKSYEESTNEIKLTLKNDTAYTIKYTAEVITQLDPYECTAAEDANNERNDGIIYSLYGNTASLSFPNGDSVSAEHLMLDKIYRSSVYIESHLKDSSKDDTTEKMCLKIKKQWDDKNNPDGSNVIHDDPVRVKIGKYYENGTDPISEEYYNIYMYGNEYYKNIKDLPTKDKDGKKYVYKVISEENPPKNYDFSVTKMEKAAGSDIIPEYGDNTYVITITNTYNDKREKMNITVKKDWSGENGNTQNRGDSVEFSIKQNGSDYITGTLDASNKWTKTFEVPKYSDDDNKTEYKYEVIETTNNPYYKSSVTSKADSDGKGMTYTITNTYIPPINLTVKKEWKGDEGHTDMRSKSVEFSITQNDSAYKTVTLTAANSWTQTLTVPSCSNDGNDTPFEYKVSETTDNLYYTTSASDTANGNSRTVTVTNTYIPRKQINITVQKAWEKDENHTALRSDSVEITVTRDGKYYKTVTLSAENGWKQTLTVPEYSDVKQTQKWEYKVKEENTSPNYTTSYKLSEDTETAKRFTVTNTFVPTDITVTKHWDDDGNEVNRADEVTFTLKQNGAEYGKYTISGSRESNDWTYTIKDVPKYDKGGKLYAYTIEEISVPDYDIEELINPNSANNYTASITNKYSPDIDLDKKITITVTKQWHDEGNEANRADEVTFILKQNGIEYGKYKISGSKDNDIWTYTVKNIPKYDKDGNLYFYTVEEEKIDGYKSKITNPTENNVYHASITNEYVPPETIDISVTKKWDDIGYKFKRPNITLKLMQGETEYDRHTIYAAENIEHDVLTYTFKNVPKNDKDGNAYSYAVKEEKLDGYTVSTSVSGNSWLITNKYIVPTETESTTTTPEKEDPTVTTPPETDPPVNPTSPAVTEPPVTTAPAAGGTVIPIWGLITSTDSAETDPSEEPEDISAQAGIFDDEFDAVRRDDILIIILTFIIITGTLILVFRHKSDKSDGKYHM